MKINNEEYGIRPVKTVDLDQLFTMLVDLAHHEGLTDRFKLTRDRLKNELFGISSDWNCLVVVDQNEKLIGFCLYSFANINRAFNLTPMIQIDNFYISPGYRNAGIGYKLMLELTLIAKTKGISRFNVWSVKDNEQAEKFYQKMGGEKLGFVEIYEIQIKNVSPDR